MIEFYVQRDKNNVYDVKIDGMQKKKKKDVSIVFDVTDINMKKNNDKSNIVELTNVKVKVVGEKKKDDDDIVIKTKSNDDNSNSTETLQQKNMNNKAEDEKTKQNSMEHLEPKIEKKKEKEDITKVPNNEPKIEEKKENFSNFYVHLTTPPIIKTIGKHIAFNVATSNFQVSIGPSMHTIFKPQTLKTNLKNFTHTNTYHISYEARSYLFSNFLHLTTSPITKTAGGHIALYVTTRNFQRCVQTKVRTLLLATKPFHIQQPLYFRRT